MRIIYAADLHGNKPAYEQLADEAARRGCRAVILGGDLLPKKGFIRDSISGQREFTERFLVPLFRRFHGAHPDIPVYWMLGNDDWAVCLEPLLPLDAERVALHIHDRVLALGDYRIAGYAFVPLTPFGTKDWEKFDTADQPIPSHWVQPVMSGPNGKYPVDVNVQVRARGTIAADLEALAQRAGPAAGDGPPDLSRLLLVSHAPPFETKLDILHTRQHVGSKALRTFIKRHQPHLTLHGHIHESPHMSGAIADRLGRTVMVNPGASERALRALAFDLEDPLGTFEQVGPGWKPAAGDAAKKR